MEVEAGLRRFLLDDDTVNGYVAGKVWKHRLEDSIDGTGGYAVVVSRTGGWAVPDSVKTAEYPKVRLELWADPTRNDDGTIRQADGETKAFGLFRAVDPLIHGERDARWGELVVVSCQRWSEPYVGDTADFEATKVIVDYAVQLIH